MRITINLFFLLMIFFTSCGGKKAPEGVLKQDDMAALLIDVHLVDGSTYNLSQVPDSIRKYALNRYINVFKQHHTDSLQFQKSLQYYSMHPDQLDDIYKQVVQNLQDKNDKLNKTSAPKHAVSEQ